MADISATKLPLKRLPYQLQGLVETRIYDISPVVDGVYTQAAHTIASIPKGYMLVGGRILYLTEFTSAGDAATCVYACNGTDLTGTITEAGELANTSIEFPLNATTATAGGVFYAKSAAITVTMTVATADITAGRFLLMLELVNAAALTDNG